MSELVFQRVLRRSALFADQPVVADLATGHSATYAQHMDRVARLCSALGELGVAPTDRVGVLAGNSHAYVELWHACLAGGGLINPLNTRLAADEIVYILNDSETEVVFADAEFAPVVAEVRDRLPALRSVVLIGPGAGDVPHDLGYESLLAAAPPSAGLPPEPGPSAPAVLMYTGGTTGLPKGVVLGQSAIVLSIYRMQPFARGRPPMSFLSFMPFTYSMVIGSVRYLRACS